MYRPTVRYDDVFKSYVDDLFKATKLDRNQIIRAALFTAGFSENFLTLMKQFQKKDVSLPSPKWESQQNGYWLEQSPKQQEKGKDVNVNLSGATEDQTAFRINAWNGRQPEQQHRRIREAERREGKIYKAEAGAIRIHLK